MIYAIMVLPALIMFHLINNFIWLYLDKTYLIYDSWYHFLLSVKVFDHLRQGSFPWLSDILGGAVYFRWHGVLVGYLSAPFYFIFGLSQDSGVMICGSIFITILILSVFGVGKEIFNRKTGLLAAFLVSVYPLVFNNLRVYMLDLPLASMVSLGIFLLLKSAKFSDKRYSFLFALVSASGLLIKFNFFLFVLGPLTLAIYGIFRKKTFKLSRRNIITAILITVLVSSGFYRLKFWEVASRIYESSWLYALSFYPGEHFASIFQRWLGLGRDYFVFFLRDCFNNSVSPVFFLLFVFGAFSRNARKMILFIWLALPLLVLAFFFHYPDYNRYFMPVLPAIALISSAGVFGLKSARLKRLLVALIIVFGILQYFAISYRLDFIPEQVQIKIPLFGSKKSIPITLFKRTVSIDNRSDDDAFSYPSRADWKNDEILSEIQRSSAGIKPEIKVFFMCSNVRVYEPIMYKISAEKLPIVIDLATMSEERGYKDADIDSYKMTSADFVVVVKDQWRDRATPLFFKKKLDDLNLLFDRNIGNFQLIREFVLNNGERAALYKKNIKSPARISREGLDIYFSDGITKIFHQGRKITSAVGLEVLFVSGEKKLSNPYFQWRAEVAAADKLVIYAEEGSLSVSMKWEIQIRSAREIGWKVSLGNSLGEAGDLCLSLSLPGRYTEWHGSSVGGKFGSNNAHAFKELKLSSPGPRLITLSAPKEKVLPAVSFSADYPSDGLPFIRWRSNDRAFGFYLKTGKLPVNEQEVFSGTISLS